MDDILLDTNVISELVRPKPDPNVVRFLAKAVDPWLCSITFHELAFGAERSPDPKRRARLLAWIAQVKAEFASRTIMVDSAVAESSGRLRALAAAQGRQVSVVDALIAGSAEARGLRVATRNTKDFEAFGVPLLNPWHTETASKRR
jgi:hypothetical protein